MWLSPAEKPDLSFLVVWCGSINLLVGFAVWIRGCLSVHAKSEVSGRRLAADSPGDFFVPASEVLNSIPILLPAKTRVSRAGSQFSLLLPVSILFLPGCLIDACVDVFLIGSIH